MRNPVDPQDPAIGDETRPHRRVDGLRAYEVPDRRNLQVVPERFLRDDVPFGSRELVDDVPDRDDLVALGLADAGLDDVDVEAALLARDLAHPVLDDPDRALRVVRGHGLAEPHPRSRLREADNRFELTWGDRDA